MAAASMRSALQLSYKQASACVCVEVFGNSTRPSGSICSSLGFFNAPLRRVIGAQRNAAVTSQLWAGEPDEGPGRRGEAWKKAAAAAVAAFSLSGSSEEAASEEEELITLLKKAKLSILRGELEAASSFLHAAAVIAQRRRHRPAIVYTYSQMANLAYVRGHLSQVSTSLLDGCRSASRRGDVPTLRPQAEKLFKAAMSYMLAGGTPQDDNAFVEMSLKLAAMYAQQNKAELAEHGFRFCLETLEVKVQKLQETPADQLTEADEVLRKDTRLLLGLCLDSRARYLASTQRLTQAADDYRKALDICRQEQGPQHHQTLVLMSDLATILDMQGRHDDALALIRQAVDAARASGHEDLHVLLANMAAVLLHAGRHDDGVRLLREALGLAREVDDREAVRHILRSLGRAEAEPDREGAESRSA
ncbi:tetratricopeptide repeat protein 19, mitochondrial isoform X1 [Phycodurus eques]|uniref:tetratricopeptide repeat protein 19, mitochondrial isoform X1 n=1 Tax=Phycodurus eques TaxID=693459 RepID=UPI002ACEE61D|nr:tetratricopeptide repeat protein 19, mitochondrial isoform X1 [Phycodurus eques]XP_061549942.1 tetratricopeptide repeat protein 19, mitochondrial isoform X1 [Phycodurus eques]